MYQPNKKLFKIRLRKGDLVMVRLGRDKGKTGKVLNVHPADNMVTVEGINMFKKHQKPNRAYPQGGILDITKPILVSKVGIVEPSSKQPSRIKFNIDAKGTKTRLFQKSSKEIK